MVLNMASDKKPGGGVRNGAMAQEEELFRRTDYHRHLPCNLYPLGDTTALYSPAVTTFRAAGSYQKCRAFQTAFLAAAAIRQPAVVNDKSKQLDYLHEADRDLMRCKINGIFAIGAAQKRDSLVLGALGCGAFGNPPHAVAKLYHDAIQRWGGCFNKIGFAVLVRNSRDQENFAAFQRLLVQGN